MIDARIAASADDLVALGKQRADLAIRMIVAAGWVRVSVGGRFRYARARGEPAYALDVAAALILHDARMALRDEALPDTEGP